MLFEILGLHERDKVAEREYELDKSHKRFKDPRVLPAAETRKKYTILRKRTRPMDFIDDVFMFLGMAYDALLNKIYRQ